VVLGPPPRSTGTVDVMVRQADASSWRSIFHKRRRKIMALISLKKVRAGIGALTFVAAAPVFRRAA
jgi:hypothetical protein